MKCQVESTEMTKAAESLLERKSANNYRGIQMIWALVGTMTIVSSIAEKSRNFREIFQRE
jgi:hypothetical protein